MWEVQSSNPQPLEKSWAWPCGPVTPALDGAQQITGTWWPVSLVLSKILSWRVTEEVTRYFSWLPHANTQADTVGHTRVYTPHLPYPTHTTPHHTAHNSQKRFTLQIKSFSRLTSAVCCYCFAYEFPDVQSPYQRRCNLVSYMQDDKMNHIGKNRIFLTEGLLKYWKRF